LPCLVHCPGQQKIEKFVSEKAKHCYDVFVKHGIPNFRFETMKHIIGHSGPCRICRSLNVKAQIHLINLFFFNSVEWLLILEP